MRAIVVAVVSGIMLLASWENVANARASGVGARPVTSSHPAPHNRIIFRRGPLWGGFIAVPAYAPEGFFDYPPYAPFPPDSAATANNPGGGAPTQRCLNPTHRTVTVPSEGGGGSKQITVTDCHP
jgi:hypothetical protein